MKAYKKRRKPSYAEKLQDRRWQKRKGDILTRDHHCCQYPDCPSTVSMLDVHHKAYLRNTDPWNYPDYCLITYCHHHHEMEQDRMERAHLAIAHNPILIQYCIDHEAESLPHHPRRQPEQCDRKPVVYANEEEKKQVGVNLFAAMRAAMMEQPKL